MNFKAIVVLLTTFVTSFSFSNLISSTASAQASGAHGPMIFDVRRSLPLEPEEPVFHDFYINAGPEAGFKKGQYITAVRPVPIQDPVLNKQQAILDVTVGYLQVIQVQRGITVARLFGELLDEERPALEYESVMIGDRIDLASLTTKAPKVKSKEKSKPKSFFSQSSSPPSGMAVALSSASAAVTSAAPPVNAPSVKQVATAESAAAGAQATTQASVQDSIQNSIQNSVQTLAQSAARAGQVSAPATPTVTSPVAQTTLADGLQTVATNSPGIATTSDSSEKASPSAKSPDMVRVPVPTRGSSN